MNKPTNSETNDFAVIFFDGVCNLCNASVNFIIDRDSSRYFRYASLQSEAGQKFLEKHGRSTTEFESIILSVGDTYYTKSAAALRIARRMDGLWPVLYGFIILPRFIRDAAYNLIARNRYKWFGKRDSCRMPEPELKLLFLN